MAIPARPNKIADFQLALLRDAGCDLGQGYLFSRPQQADALLAWLNRLDNPADSGTVDGAEEDAVPSGSLPSSLAG